MVDTTHKELKGHPVVSATTIHGWPSIVFGLPFMVAGIFIVLVSLRIIPCPDSRFHAPREMVASFGGLFFLGGFFLLVNGWTDLWRKAKIGKIQQEHPNEIWDADYRWNQRGIKDNGLTQLMKNFGGTISFFVFLAPFNWFVFYMKGMPFFVKILLILFNLIVVGILVYCSYLLLRYIKYGTSWLWFNKFPFFLGGKLDGILETSKMISGLKDITINLRCVEERYEVRGTGENRSEVVISYQIYADSLIVNSAVQYQSGILRLPISFSLPEGNQYETCLRDRPARYWELEIKAQTPGVDYDASFFVPVYAKK